MSPPTIHRPTPMATLPKVEAFGADRDEDFEPDPDGDGDR